MNVLLKPDYKKIVAADWSEYKAFFEPFNASVAVIGNFDGVHIAHQKLILECVAKAKELGLPSVLITFDPHPATLFAPSSSPHVSLISLEERLEYIKELGIDLCCVLSFTKDFADQDAASFARSFLEDFLHCKNLIVGYDFCMGSDKVGGLALEKLLYSFSCQLSIHPEVFCPEIPLASGNEFFDRNKCITVSSSAIRRALAQGDIMLVNTMLGRLHSVVGMVIHGAKRGSTLLGFPTANMDTGNLLLPKAGVYATSLSFESEINEDLDFEHKSISNIGYNPTFGENKLALESYILDFNKDIYGSIVRVYFHERMRSERKFQGIEELKEQLAKDKKFRQNY